MTQCEYPSCFKLGWRKARYCETHIFTASKPQHNGFSRDAVIDNNLRFRETQWTCGEAFERVLNNRGRTKVVCLDLEFSSISRKVFEVGLCEYPSGKELVNARIKHDCTELELHQSSKSMRNRPFSFAISKRASTLVYGKDRTKCTDLVDVHNIAAQFREHGITPQSIILTWHLNTMDLVLLKEFFEEAGYYDILPPNENCIPMIPQFQKNSTQDVGRKTFSYETRDPLHLVL